MIKNLLFIQDIYTSIFLIGIEELFIKFELFNCPSCADVPIKSCEFWNKILYLNSEIKRNLWFTMPVFDKELFGEFLTVWPSQSVNWGVW